VYKKSPRELGPVLKYKTQMKLVRLNYFFNTVAPVQIETNGEISEFHLIQIST
jgi:hypothetical protein